MLKFVVKNKAKAHNEQGFAIAELMVALMIIAAVLVIGAGAIVSSSRSVLNNELRDRGVQLVQDELEQARATNFNSLGLSEDSPGYRARVGTKYTVTLPDGVEPVIVPTKTKEITGNNYDIRTDVVWYGASAGNVYNPAAAPTGNQCAAAKQVIVNVSWKDAEGKVKKSQMSWVRTPTPSECVPTTIPELEPKVEVPAPTNAAVAWTYTGGGVTSVSWSYNSVKTNVVGYSIEVFDNTTQAWASKRTVPVSQTNLQTNFTPMIFGSAFRVCAYPSNDNGGMAAQSCSTSVTPTGSKPGLPGPLQIMSSTASETSFMWTKSTNANGYVVHWFDLQYPNARATRVIPSEPGTGYASITLPFGLEPGSNVKVEVYPYTNQGQAGPVSSWSSAN